MPAIKVTNVCQYTPGSDGGDYDGDLTPIDPPSWFHFLSEGGDSYSYTIDNDAPLGTYQIDFEETSDYITIIIEDCSIEVPICIWTNGSIGPIDPPEDDEGWELDSTNATGQVAFLDAYQTIAYLFGTPGTYYMTLVSLDKTPTQWLVYRFVVTACGEEDDTCQSHPMMITWLNQSGGHSSYIFNAKKTYGVDIGENKTWEDTDNIVRYSEIKNIFDTVIQPSGYIPESHVDLLKGLRYSIQAWVVFDYGTADQVAHPIFNYTKSFELKKQRNGLYKYDFEFSYSTKILTQTA